MLPSRQMLDGFEIVAGTIVRPIDGYPANQPNILRLEGSDLALTLQHEPVYTFWTWGQRIGTMEVGWIPLTFVDPIAFPASCSPRPENLPSPTSSPAPTPTFAAGSAETLPRRPKCGRNKIEPVGATSTGPERVSFGTVPPFPCGVEQHQPPPQPCRATRKDYPMVDFLLGPSASMRPSTRHLFVNRGARPTVGVMGLHRSGTHVLLEYVRRFFNVDTVPKPVKRDSGTLKFPGDFEIWKHTVPLGPFKIPEVGQDGGPVVILLTVREIQSWMASLATHAYEIFPTSGRKRAQGRLGWMLEEVRMETRDALFKDPFPGSVFSSVPALWLTYVKNYVQGAMCEHRDGARFPIFLIVRFEDIVHRPDVVVAELEEFGLPRNGATFAPVEESMELAHPGKTWKSRTSIMERIGGTSAIDLCAQEGISGEIHEQMAAHVDLFGLLGYALP